MSDEKNHPFFERFRSLRREGERESDFSKRIGVSTSTWKAYENRTSLPKINVATDIAKNIGISVGWLLGEDGQIIAENRSSVTESDMVLVPVLDVRVSAGPGTIIDSEPETGVMALKREMVRSLGISAPGHLRILEAQGNSMEPTIRAGDLLLIDTVIDHVQGEGIYVFRWNGSVVVKRIRITRTNGVELVSDNGGHIEKVPEGELPDLHAAGRVVRVIRAV